MLTGAGGVQRVVLESSAALADRGNDVMILAATAPGGLICEPSGVRIEYRDPGRRIAGRYRVPEQFGRDVLALGRSVDVIHAHQPLASTTLIAAVSRAPKVVSCYAHPPTGTPSRRKRREVLTRLVVSRFDSIVAISGAERSLLAKQFGIEGTEIVVVRPGHMRGVDSDAQPSDAAKPPGRRLVLAVASLVKHKRMELVVQAVARVRLQLDADLVIVGDGPEMPRLRSSCRSAGLDPDGSLLGAVSEQRLTELYRSADCFVTMSSEESFGIALLDAAAAGARIVASDIPSHREIVGLAGLDDKCLVPVDADVGCVAEALLDQLRASPKRLTGSIPSWASCAEALEKIYKTVAAARPAR